MNFDPETSVNLDSFLLEMERQQWIPQLQPVPVNDLNPNPQQNSLKTTPPPPPPYPGTMDSTSPVEWYQTLDQALSPPPIPSPSPGIYSSCSTPMPHQQCTSPTPSVWSEATELPELNAELDLSEAIMAAEATGSQMPVIKNDLKYKIQKRRRESGLEELKVVYKNKEPEVLTDKDKERRERRRASNRRAATKCRIKKKSAAQQKEEERKELEIQNEELRAQIKSLEMEKEQFLDLIKHHEPCFKNTSVR